jgi:membrane protein DedA with SNARE-associated domain
VKLAVIGLLGAALPAVFGIELPKNLGYAAVGILVGIESMGVPAPGESALILAGIAAAGGRLDIVLVIVVAAAAAIVGDNIGYAIGRVGGRRLLERKGFLYERRMRLLALGDKFFERHGPKAVFLGRWIALLRITAAWMAGANRMEFRKFFLYNALGGIGWATCFGLLAYWLGEAAEKALKDFGVFAAIALGVVVVAGFVWIKRRERRAVHEHEQR